MTRLSAKTEIGVTPLTTRINASVSTIESPPASIGSARSDHAAEDPEREQEEQRERDQLGAKEIVLRLRPHLLVRDGGPADLSRQRGGQALRDGGMLAGACMERRGDEHVAPVGRNGGARLDDGDRRFAPKPRRRHGRLHGTRHDEHRRAGHDPGGVGEQLERPEALRRAVLEIVVARAQVARRRRTDERCDHSQDQGHRQDRARSAQGEIGESPKHRPAA